MEKLRQQIVAEMRVKPSIDPAKEISRRIGFIKETLQASGMKMLVLGISGGVDSSLCGRLCQIACDELGDDYNFVAVRLPYGTQADEDDAQLALRFIKPDISLAINIKSGTDGIHESVMASVADAGMTMPSDFKRDFTKGNSKARMRMIAQYEVAGMYNGLVPGTDHSAENISGFYTKHGDGACDLAPLFGLNKRQVRLLAETLGAPASVHGKAPTADLEDDRPQLLDEVSLGVSYDQIDDFLEGREVDEEAEKIILNNYLKTRHKRDDVPTPV